MRKYYYLVLLIVIGFSCVGDVKKRNLTADTFIFIDRDEINREVMLKASTYIESVQYIPLETNQDNLISNSLKINTRFEGNLGEKNFSEMTQTSI
ncbi:hypothetical protein [Proteiniphilum sp. X52]|uniref:hypothetical protein n=1 Tax=Proteiniphilum sp. X52 TaxID=2382159 RepID=UPI000F0A2A97|nr:hypothetical protein [Proteiniphilum sp. X52]RNC66096.1 hypothetical protein D7D25_03945 [Proteiniphilum sp. X52]